MVCNSILISLSIKCRILESDHSIRDLKSIKNLPLIEEGFGYSGRSNEKVSPSFT